MAVDVKMFNESPENMSEAQIRGVGRQVGMILSASLMKTGSFTFIEPIFKLMVGSDVAVNVFCNELIQTLSQAFEDGVEGVKNRATMSRDLKAVECEMRYQATHYAADQVSKGSVDVVKHLEHMIETANVCGICADTFHEPIGRNLNNLVAQGKQLGLVDTLVKQQQARQEDVVHDHKCDDPNCSAHTSH